MLRCDQLAAIPQRPGGLRPDQIAQSKLSVTDRKKPVSSDPSRQSFRAFNRDSDRLANLRRIERFQCRNQDAGSLFNVPDATKSFKEHFDATRVDANAGLQLNS